MKVLFITPTFYPTISGNTITVDRISKNLRKLGVKTKVVIANKFNISILKTFKPDLVHRFHATKSYVGELPVPNIVTFTGTDINVDLYHKKKQEVMKKSLKQASCFTMFLPRRHALKDIKNLLDVKITCDALIPQAVMLEDSSFDLRKKFKLENKFIFLLVAGIRQVKDPLYAVREIGKLREEFPYVTLVILGEVMDKNIKKQLQKYSWVTTALLPHNYMKAAYKAADIVLNTSDSEGMSGAINESMSMEKLVLASDIAGNAHVPKKYRFKKKSGELCKIAKRYLLRKEKPVYKKCCLTPLQEAKAYLKIYQKLTSHGP